MKICAIICEYNPFHNGHRYQIQATKEATGADYILCVMSGNFVQRGEAAIFHKRLRANHALLGGADAVIELPTIFATANAELFAKGAIKLLSAIPEVSFLSFGAETADAQALLNAASLLNDEPKDVSEKIKAEMQNGFSYAKARSTAWQDKIPAEILNSPNNILALEYTKAILSYRSDIKICPIQRLGGGYNDETLQESFSSATAIRKSLTENANDTRLFNALPSFVPKSINGNIQTRLKTVENYALITTKTDEIANVLDCSEGLEHAFLRAVKDGETEIAEALTSARYTTSRLKRILLQNALQIRETDIRDALNSSLYLKVLAVKKESEALLSVLGNANAPLLIRPRDEEKLTGEAKTAYLKDKFADELYRQLSGEKHPDKPMFV